MDNPQVEGRDPMNQQRTGPRLCVVVPVYNEVRNYFRLEKPMTALVTGGAGFIGSHLSEALVARGERVIILDDLSTGSVNNIRHSSDPSSC